MWFNTQVTAPELLLHVIELLIYNVNYCPVYIYLLKPQIVLYTFPEMYNWCVENKLVFKWIEITTGLKLQLSGSA